MTAHVDLLKYASWKYSQCGEDGILSRIFEILPQITHRQNWCVEFGAWDGKHLSNTAYMIEKNGFNAVLIEPDINRFKELKCNFSDTSKFHCINSFVETNGDKSLDNILGNLNIPHDFELLSIDIDGNDFHIWKTVTKHFPKVVVIEYNPTIPDNVEFVQANDFSIQQGSSIKSLYTLAVQKGYFPVCITLNNLICVKNEFSKLFDLSDNSLAFLRKDHSLETYLFCGYDGSVHLAGLKKMPWHQIPYCLSKFQHVFKFLRKYPDNYNFIERFIYRFLRKYWDILSKYNKGDQHG